MIYDIYHRHTLSIYTHTCVYIYISYTIIRVTQEKIAQNKLSQKSLNILTSLLDIGYMCLKRSLILYKIEIQNEFFKN